MNQSNSTNNLELAMLHNSIVNLNNYIRTVNSSIEYLNNTSANIRYMQEHINNHYHTINLQLMTHATSSMDNNYDTNDSNAHDNAHSHSHTHTHANTNNETNELTLEYFKEVSLNNLKTIINNNVTECRFSTLCEPLNESCSITHEEFTPDHIVCKINNCGHIFNSKAINSWLITHQSCPNCRYNILTNSNIISYTDQDSNNSFFFYTNELIKFFLFIHQLF
jgi:hypothetical protein